MQESQELEVVKSSPISVAFCLEQAMMKVVLVAQQEHLQLQGSGQQVAWIRVVQQAEKVQQEPEFACPLGREQQG